MTFSQLKYSEKQAEKAALASLLNKYFETRASPQTSKKGNVDNVSQRPLTSGSDTRKSMPDALPVKSKPPNFPSRTPPVAESSSTSPLPGPPPINRKTRPVATKITPPSNPPPPIETPAQWAGTIPTFQYPPPDHVSPGIDLFNRFLPYAINELHSAAIAIFNILYPDPAEFQPKTVHSPVSLIMRDMDGVAHAANAMSYSGTFSGQRFPNVTHRSDFVFSTKYLASLESHSDPAFEIRGIILHELTHTFQFSAENCPGGLTEGIADFVRLRGGCAAKHWTENPTGKSWDQGYETTAYFLDWADKNVYEGIVAHVNNWLGKNKTYDERTMFDSVMPGWSWDILWEQYLASR